MFWLSKCVFTLLDSVFFMHEGCFPKHLLTRAKNKQLKESICFWALAYQILHKAAPINKIKKESRSS
tara:strand:- start:358 stop:558 length:201 start_codon:yes stop_codon:yes gene_type:complete